MKIELHEISVRDIFEGYEDLEENGIKGYGGKLNIRPAYQREFVYNDKQQKEVINTLKKDFPLNVMYWVKHEDETFDLMDGQQRTLSICKFLNNEFSIDFDGQRKQFHNLTQDKQNELLDKRKLLVYWCEGTESEVLDWFRIINIAGLELKEQEMLNATHTGPWLSHAKTIFSKNNCAAYLLSKDYVKAEVDRQGLLEIALKWISKDKVEDYMNNHQHDPNANELWTYFQNVINWVKLTFITKYPEMKSVNWGELYDEYKDQLYDTNELDSKIKKLMEDYEIQKPSGVWNYVLSGKEKYLNLRDFTLQQKREAYNRQSGICPFCIHEGKTEEEAHWEFEEMEGDHITPWSQGGKTTSENCQMLCITHNRTKGDR